MRLISLYSLLLAASASSFASAATITFDDRPNEVVTTQYQSLGIVFQGNEWFASDDFAGTILPSSGTKYVRARGDGTALTLQFVLPTFDRGVVDSFSLTSPALAGFGTLDGCTLVARDFSGLILDSETIQPAISPPGRSASIITLDGIGIYEVAITNRVSNAGGSALPFDDIQFGAVRSVPEPAVIGATGMFIAILVRRNRD